MNIVWFSWKDIRHPQAGGAENISWHLMQNLIKDGHRVRLITAFYPGSKTSENISGVEIIRRGRKVSVYYQAKKYFKQNLTDWADFCIDEMNTIPFGCAFYNKTPSVLLAYQLARSVWFYQLPLPLSVIGYLIEPMYLRALARRYQKVITESQSTKNDMVHFGFKPKQVGVFRVGIELNPLNKLPPKDNLNKILILGAVRPMKRTLSAVKGFEFARDFNSSLKLTLAGNIDGPYGNKVAKYISNSRHSDAIKILGRVSQSEKIDLMRSSTVILVTSIKEGWGLIVTEANSQGTPAISYDCDGLRDSVLNNQTGILVKSGAEQELGQAVNTLLSDPVEYLNIRQAAWQLSKSYTFEQSYKDFIRVSGINDL